MKRISAARSRSQRGFSLAEVLTATAIFALIFVAALMMYDRSNRVYKQGVEAADMQQSTRVAFDKMVSELRMTGFDYDRDGTPSSTLASSWQANAPYSIGNLVEPDPPNGFVYRATTGGTSAATQPAWNTAAGSQTNENAPSTVVWQLATDVQYQQPDEQIEYAGAAVVGIRANFDYEFDLGNCIAAGAECQNGRETGYESDAYPLVTTGNDEIVIYALRPVTPPSGGLPQLSFFADMSKPRSVSIGSGAAEEEIELPRNYDPCTGGCNNPPYTLYRITFEDDDGVSFVETPVAENIRSMQVRYFRDAAATDEITVLPDGAGAFDGSDPYATVAGRDLRGEVRSIRLNLVGMNPQPDGSYTDPTDAVAPRHRKYQLETLIVPRNIGRHGMKEFNTQVPGPPTLDTVCAGSCNAVYVAWTAAATGGDVESYNILYDTDPTSCNGGVPVNFTFAEDAGRNLEGYASLWITPGQTYYFAVQAISKYGNATSNCMSAAVLNTTQPEAPTTLEASGDGTRPEEANQVSLFWPPVTENDDSNKIVPCSTGVSRDTKIMPAAEKRYYRIYKSRNPTVVPGAAGTTEILNEFSPVQPSTVGTNLSFVDTAAANCLPYYYRIMTVDHCFRDASWNTGNNVNLARSTDYFPALGTDGIRGQAAENLTAPAAPQGFSRTTAVCNLGLCDIGLAWSAVTKNDGQPTGPDITIDQYIIKAEVKDVVTGVFGPANLWPGNTVPNENAVNGGALTTSVTGLSQLLEYRFTVRAKDCIDGVQSPPVYYPCSFAGGTVSITAPVNFGGAGTAANPWVTEAPATIAVTTQNAVAEISATFSQGGTPVGAPFSRTGSITSASIPIPDIADGVPALVAVTIKDLGATGCTVRYEYYVIDQPPPLCALEDDQNNPNVVVWTSASDRQVFVQLRNTSTDNLLLQKIFVRWTPGTAQRTASNLDSVDFGTGTVISGCDRGNTEIAAPANTFIAGGATRNLVINFRRARSQAINTNPVNSICVVYRAPAGDVLSCSIAPTSGTCTAPGVACQ